MASAADKALIAALGNKLTSLGPFLARPMFGGYGLYIDGLIFGLLASGQVYLKVGESNRSAFETAGSVPFSFESTRGETTITSYWRCPDDVLADARKLRAWVYGALIASRNARQKKPARKTTRKSSRQRNPFL